MAEEQSIPPSMIKRVSPIIIAAKGVKVREVFFRLDDDETEGTVISLELAL